MPSSWPSAPQAPPATIRMRRRSAALRRDRRAGRRNCRDPAARTGWFRGAPRRAERRSAPRRRSPGRWGQGSAAGRTRPSPTPSHNHNKRAGADRCPRAIRAAAAPRPARNCPMRRTRRPSRCSPHRRWCGSAPTRSARREPERASTLVARCRSATSPRRDRAARRHRRTSSLRACRPARRRSARRARYPVHPASCR